jgi:hypothetical protein
MLLNLYNLLRSFKELQFFHVYNTKNLSKSWVVIQHGSIIRTIGSG